jgi:hypothetical protein
MRRLAIIVPLLAMAGGSVADAEPPQSRYVTATGWNAGSRPDFLEEWWGGQLRKMREPVLSGPASGAGYRQRFRLLMTRSRGMPVAVRIDERGDGSVIARRVRLDNRDLAEARISEDRTVALGRAQKLRLARAIRASNLRTAVREALVKPDKPGTVTLCVHPTTYVFELVEAGRNRFIYRSACDISYKLRKLAETVEALVPARAEQ